MAQIIPNGGTRESQDRYVGAPNELTVDQSNRDLRLHDGSTPGGYRIPNLDTLDDMFQPKSAELDGLQFTPAARGLLVRLRAGAYAIRKLIGDGGVTLDNADGYAGDITIRLGQEITQDMTFNGDVLMQKVLQVKGGVLANTRGDHFGGVDSRGATLVLDDNQIHQTWVAGLTDALAKIKDTSLPIGSVILWAGELSKIPVGWALCDGTNGTIDLRGKFVAGSASDSHLASGGSAEHSHTITIQAGGSHQHGGAVADTVLQEIHIPAHKHLNGICDDSTGDLFNHGSVGANPQTGRNVQHDSGRRGVYEGYTTETGGNQPHSHGLSIDSAGNHTHGGSVSSEGHIPPYVKLAYIMRIS